MPAAPCKECGRRPKSPGRHRCLTCQLRHEPIGDQVRASRRRLAMVPEDLRVKRTLLMARTSPVGTDWCAGCQSFRDYVDFRNTPKTTHTRCYACRSAKQHETMVAKTYGLETGGYDRLLAEQGGRCAICRARPKSKRLAVDHDHRTGAVRGLLCSRCNHDLMGSAWDSMAMAAALWHYMNTPPASGAWLPPDRAPQLGPLEAAVRPSPAPEPSLGIVTPGGREAAGGRNVAAVVAGYADRPAIPVGAIKEPNKRGVWKIFVEPDADPPF